MTKNFSELKKSKLSNAFSLTDLPENYKFNGIDILKFIFAFFICMTHIDIFPENSRKLIYINFLFKSYICRIAVPFYFTASGFLLFRKIENGRLSSEKLKKYCFKILRLLGTWYFLLFVGGNCQLWFLGALVLATTILYLMYKNNLKIQSVAFISILLFFIGVLGDSYYGFLIPLKKYSFLNFIITEYEVLFGRTMNGLFFGLIFVFIGSIFAQKRIAINNILAFFCFIASMALLLVEEYLLIRFSQPKELIIMISLIPATFFLFYFSTHIKLKDSLIYRKIRAV